MFALPSAAFSESGIIERIRSARAGSGDAGRPSRNLFANKNQFRAASTSHNVSVAGLEHLPAKWVSVRRGKCDHEKENRVNSDSVATEFALDGRARAILRNVSDIQTAMTDGSAGLDARPDRCDFCKPQKIVPKGETRLDGANNKNVSLHAQGRTARNPSECASSSPRSWPIGHDSRSVRTATSLPPTRSQTAARTAKPHARPSCNDHLAR